MIPGMQVEMTAEAMQGLADAPTGMKGRINEVLARLESWPNVSGAKPVRHELRGAFRIRTGSWRVLFRIKGQCVPVFRIDDRRDVYER